MSVTKYTTQEVLNKTIDANGSALMTVHKLAITSIASQTSTNDFADWSGSIVDTQYSDGHISFVYTVATNTLSVKFLASIDGTTYVEVVAAADKVAGTYTNTFENAPYRYYKVQAESKVDDTHGTIVGHSAVR